VKKDYMVFVSPQWEKEKHEYAIPSVVDTQMGTSVSTLIRMHSYAFDPALLILHHPVISRVAGCLYRCHTALESKADKNPLLEAALTLYLAGLIHVCWAQLWSLKGGNPNKMVCAR
jgi:hypothetical protein